MKTFELKEEHIKLLAAASWFWSDCESGAPAIDPKRPFGNSGKTSICHDVKEILGVPEGKPCPHCGEDIDDTEENLEQYWQLYTEIMTAIEVIFSARTMEPGIYEKHQKCWFQQGMVRS